MFKHILTIIKNERRQNIGLWIELLIVALFLWYIVDNVYVTLNNYYKPLGFDTEHTYIMRLGLLNESSYEYVKDISTETAVGYLYTALERIQRNPMIEAASISFHSSPHIGSNRSRNIHRDTLSTKYSVLNRTVTPNFFRVFKYQVENGSTDELVQALERNELVISPGVAKELFPHDEPPVGKQVSFEKSDSAQLYRVGAVSRVVRYDNFSNWNSYFAQRIDNDFLKTFTGEWVGGLEFCVRVTPEEDHDFIRRFRENMTQQLRLGNYYLGEIQSIPINKKAFQKDDINDLKMRMFIVFFLLVNIFLGITGIFWFRTQHRRSEIGLRVSLGDTPKQVLRKFYIEGLLLLTTAMVPTMIVIYILGREGIFATYLMHFTPGRYFIGFAITYILLIIMIVLGIRIPALKAVKVPPATALRDE
ncbi:ABC transporter permease [Proteiniphilum acetatigenes]|uniref:ABC transporter permease n=1 Tax=Proteiniphilum acetatigenes TaxID=294710 RepID=UPI00037C1CC6|nr:FtsX-like permease family protein [Proteiniphilum acetatigenes]